MDINMVTNMDISMATIMAMVMAMKLTKNNNLKYYFLP